MAYGSFHLAIETSDSDIDLICVVPASVDMQRDFFGALHDQLSSNADVSQIVKVEKSFIPLLKFVFQGIKVDLSFAQMTHQTIPKLTERQVLSESILSEFSSEISSW